MRFSATEIARVVGGDLVSGATADADVAGVAIDSRLVSGGELFVPIVAERDGHEFIAVAVANGAVAYLTSNGPVPVDGAALAIKVNDTGRALLELGTAARSRLSAEVGDRVIGITGSVGKTTVKDLTAAALAPRYTVQSSPRSFNNELGVPLTLANSPDDVEAVVVEMGARGRGHIAQLCDVARPTVGVVTTVALAHAEMFGTVDEVAAAKGELVESLPSNGTAVLNGDHPLVIGMASLAEARVLTFGLDTSGLDVTASAIELDDELRPSFHLHSPWGGADVSLPVRGVHQVMNALAAASAAMACGGLPEEVARGLANAVLSPWRMDLQRTARGAIVLNDAYNANPTSMEAALRSLAALPAVRRIAVVGVMAELGAVGPDEHRRIADLADDLGIELIAVAAPDYGVSLVRDIDGALEALGPLVADVAVLVKGSRVAGLERLVDQLLR
ncbi:MAG: UDP-N-acetylmuramoyl-tripeptide--D-alanyl-D-alanine ligase [Acidimicrobiaceae bacterium]